MLLRVRSRAFACYEGSGYRDRFGSWVVFWDNGTVSYPSEKEVIVIGENDNES